jgi:hypothetical protein
MATHTRPELRAAAGALARAVGAAPLERAA